MKRALRILHWIVIANFLAGAAYSTYMLFFVVGGGGPLFQRAAEIPFEVLVVRRLYAIETWVILTGLAIYLVLTGGLPGEISHPN